MAMAILDFFWGGMTLWSGKSKKSESMKSKLSNGLIYSYFQIGFPWESHRFGGFYSLAFITCFGKSRPFMGIHSLTLDNGKDFSNEVMT